MNDLTGQKFGQLTVVERRGSDKHGHVMWFCGCDCGGEIVARGADLRRGHTVGCGCQQSELIDETGNQYGRLTVIGRAPNEVVDGTMYTMWRCRCECGQELVVASGRLRGGIVTGCGCRHPLPEGEAAFNALYARWKHRAKKKGLSFSLTREQLFELSKSNCFYCGAAPAQVRSNPHGNGSFVYNGLDRLDNSQGYTPENVVPCCGTCNHAKATLSVDEFRDLVRRIYEHWASKED